MHKFLYPSDSPTATTALGKIIGKNIKARSVIALIGELGCGKTLLTRGICDGLEVPLRQVNSPTFVLVNEYPGRLPVFHMDLYRLAGPDEGVDIGLLDYLARAETGVMLVEWAEKILPLLPDDHLRIEFEILSERKRQIELSSTGDRFDSLFQELKRR